MSLAPRVLVVDDEPSICWAMEQLGAQYGYATRTVNSAEQAFDVIDEHDPNVILLDVRLPGLDGLSALRRLQESRPDTPVVLMTAYGDLDTAVRAVESHVFEYIVKPFDLERIRAVIENAARHGHSPAGRAEQGGTTATDEPSEEFVGTSHAMREVFRRIALAAAAEATVLITGESGTGKELAARAIHRNSARADGPFVAVNIASIPGTLVESHLFGHRQGAFTGATRDHDGLLAQANGGTLFLDEIAEIPLEVQVKLLRALEDRTVVPVGGGSSQPVDFRVIAATHQDLLHAVSKGSFRHDLYFRLAAFPLHLPPLRERTEDIPLLAHWFLRQLGRADATITDETLTELNRRTWVGNVRELRNAVEHALVLSRGGPLQPWHLPPPLSLTAAGADCGHSTEALRSVMIQWTQRELGQPASQGQLYERAIEVLESALFETVLAHTRGNYRKAAEILGIHRTTLKRRTESSTN